MASTQKDIIYIDVDDEITAIIEKLRASEQRIVALVLPKRASVLQSIVNMKLLKRTAENEKKHIVLITSEAGLLPLAGAVGLHVANNLQSKPAIPPAPESFTAEDTDGAEDFDANAMGDRPVGQLAYGTKADSDGSETIELDDEPDKKPLVAGGLGAAGVMEKGKDKKLKIPDFNKFRLLLALGLLAVILLGVGVYFANAVLPKATITIATNSSDIETRKKLTLAPEVMALDQDMTTLPARTAQKQQTATQQVSTTGQKNNGTKASGEVKVINCSGGEDLVIPAGTGVSANSFTFITQEEISIPLESNTCKDTALTSDVVKVVAINAGAQYNIAPATFAVAGQGNSVKASSSEAMSGGTDNIVKVLAQADIENAKQKMAAQDNAGVKSDLQKKLEADGYFAILNTLHAGDPVLTPSAAVGDQTDTVTVTQQIMYTMYGAKSDDIRKVIVSNVKDQIDPKKQQILDDGFSKASFQVEQTAASGPVEVTLTASSLAGPDIRSDDLKKTLAGKKSGEVKSIVEAIPGVTGVNVKYSPFWVSSVPKKENKVNIVIQKASNASNGN